MWPSQCSGNPHSTMVEIQLATQSLSVQVLVHSPPVEQMSQLLYPTMWCTLSVLWPPTAMGTAVLQWQLSELVWGQFRLRWRASYLHVCMCAVYSSCQNGQWDDNRTSQLNNEREKGLPCLQLLIIYHMPKIWRRLKPGNKAMYISSSLIPCHAWHFTHSLIVTILSITITSACC